MDIATVVRRTYVYSKGFIHARMVSLKSPAFTEGLCDLMKMLSYFELTISNGSVFQSVGRKFT
jgi:hypothetical protein